MSEWMPIESAPSDGSANNQQMGGLLNANALGGIGGYYPAPPSPLQLLVRY